MLSLSTLTSPNTNASLTSCVQRSRVFVLPPPPLPPLNLKGTALLPLPPPLQPGSLTLPLLSNNPKCQQVVDRLKKEAIENFDQRQRVREANRQLCLSQAFPSNFPPTLPSIEAVQMVLDMAKQHMETRQTVILFFLFFLLLPSLHLLALALTHSLSSLSSYFRMSRKRSKDSRLNWTELHATTNVYKKNWVPVILFLLNPNKL
jgi:hypothetical protein